MADPKPRYGTDSQGRRVVSYDGGVTSTPVDAAPAPNQAAPAPAASGKRFDQQPVSPGQGILNDAQDFATGFGTSLAMGGDDEIVGGATAVGNALGLTDKTYDEGREDYAATKTTAETRSPMINGVGQGVGAVTGAVGVGAAAGALKAGTMAAKGARALANPAVQGAVSGALSAEPDSRGVGAVTGGVIGGVGGKVVKSIGNAGTRLFSGEAGRVGRVAADEARVKAAGMSIAEAADQPGGVARQAATQRKLGIGEGLFDTKGAMRQQASDAVDAAGGKRDEIYGRLKDEVTSGQNVAQRLRRAMARLPDDQSPGGAGGGADRDFLEEQAKEVSRQRIAAPAVTKAPIRRADPATKEMKPSKGTQEPFQPALPNAPGTPSFSSIKKGPPAPPVQAPQAPAKEVDRLLSFEELDKRRLLWGDKANFSKDPGPAGRRNLDVRNAVAETQEELGNHVEDGLGTKYSELGQDMQGGIAARDALSRGTGGDVPMTYLQTMRQLGSGVVANSAAHAREGAAAAQGWFGPAGGKVNKSMLEKGYTGASQAGQAAANWIAEATTDEDRAVREYQQNAINPDYRLSRMSKTE